MTANEFISILKDNLEIEDAELTEKTVLATLPEYDSLALMSIIALVDEYFGEKLTAQKLATITTVESLMTLIGLDHFKD
jgi:acyl carrier protein